ncbi:four helix bundle protein [Hippea jasoniae]|uniref:four helix bundle protein n=1 Tax=Hippea jasoniae TaxID=944479 RepID=UPI0018DD8A35|nr:four helix bundle protein [Hippea jasoniae]
MKDYKELRVWNESMDLVVEIYKIIKKLSKRRKLCFVRSNKKIGYIYPIEYCRRDQ